MNMKMQYEYKNYLRSTDYKLEDVYNRYSVYKAHAWRYSEKLCREYAGRDLKIVSHNCMMFTAGFIFPHPDTGESCYMHITKRAVIWEVIV